MKMKTLSMAVSLVWLAAGCASLAPDYERPTAPVSASWPEIPGYEISGEMPDQMAAEIHWRDFFTDPTLQQLIDTALKNNRDLRVTALNVQRAQALYRIQRADTLPTIGISGSGNSQRLPGDLSETGEPRIARQYSADIGMTNFEFDFFGRVASLRDQALETYLASENTWRSGQISLVAAVASSYLNLLADREHLTVARETLTAQQASYNLVKVRYENGISSELDLRQAQTAVETSRADVANYVTAVAQDENALVLLLGTNGLPETIVGNRHGASISAIPILNPGEVPSAVLQKRPDVVFAEHTLKAANANIGAARAAFFPSISLTTSIGTASASLSGLFDAGSGAWLFMPQISLPIFDSGRNMANLEVAEVARDIALAQYEKAIQSAFSEVADALAQSATIDEQLSAQKALFEATQATHTLSQARYEKGVDNYLTVLDAERSMYSAGQGLVSMQLLKQMNQVALYKALGGGIDQYEFVLKKEDPWMADELKRKTMN